MDVTRNGIFGLAFNSLSVTAFYTREALKTIFAARRVEMVGLMALDILGAVGTAVDGESARAADAEGFCNSRVVRHSLSYEAPDPVVRVNLAFGKSLVVKFVSRAIKLVDEAVVGDIQL